VKGLGLFYTVSFKVVALHAQRWKIFNTNIEELVYDERFFSIAA
jgi:hypothetical protein